MASVAFRHVDKVYPDGFHAVSDLNLEIRDGEFVVLVGPSGCGKSTTLRMLAGLEEVTRGDVFIGDRCVNDVEPGQRDIAMVFQNYALYPHMTVRQNLGFGLKMRRTPKAEIHQRVAAVAETLGIAPLLDKRPREMSGGQRQRVALGRAIVRDPQVFLFDEPLSNLDAKLRVQMRAEIAALHRRLKSTMIYVTHDQVEAMTLGERIVLMNHGVVQQADAPLQLYRRPANRFVAGFIGSPPMNFLTGEIVEGVFRFGGGQIELRDRRAAGPIGLGVRAEDVTLGGEGPQLPEVTLAAVEQMGHEAMAYFELAGSPFAMRLSADQPHALGDRVAPRLRPASWHLFETGEVGKRID